MAKWNKKVEKLAKKVGKEAEKAARKIRDGVRDLPLSEEAIVVLKKLEHIVRDVRDDVRAFANSKEAKRVYNKIKKFSNKAENETREFFEREDVQLFTKTVEEEALRIAKQAENLARKIRDRLKASKSKSSEDALKGLDEVDNNVQKLFEDPEFAVDNADSVLSNLTDFAALLNVHINEEKDVVDTNAPGTVANTCGSKDKAPADEFTGEAPASANTGDLDVKPSGEASAAPEANESKGEDPADEPSVEAPASTNTGDLDVKPSGEASAAPEANESKGEAPADEPSVEAPASANTGDLDVKPSGEVLAAADIALNTTAFVDGTLDPAGLAADVGA